MPVPAAETMPSPSLLPSDPTATRAKIDSCFGEMTRQNRRRRKVRTILSRGQETFSHRLHSLLTLVPTAALAASSKLRSRPLASTIDPFPRLLAFCGVFDGHDGARAADYCAKGLLAHIFLEATELSKKRSPPNASAAGRLRRRFSPSNAKSELATDFALKEAVQELSDPLEAAYVRAFHHAQERFGAGLEPPVPACKLSKLGKQLSWRSLLRPKSQQVVDNLVPGGTTACTLSLVSYLGEDVRMAIRSFVIPD